MPRQYSAQVRERVIGLLEEGRDDEELTGELGIPSATIYWWRKQSTVDAGEIAGVNSAIAAALTDPRRRIHELDEELAATQFAALVLRDQGSEIRDPSICPKDGSQSLKP
jgi:transposase-like protein